MLLIQNSIKTILNQKQYYIISKKIHVSSTLKSVLNKRKIEEIKIPVPWGHLAAKWWGPQDKRPILCFHGWQESCGSFDPLFSRLPETIGLLAVDFPGQGRSSRLPEGIYYHFTDAPILIRRIQNYFQWPKVSLLGHSMGGMTSFLYPALYPNDVDLFISIDGLKPLSKEPGSAINSTARNIDKFLQYEADNEINQKPPSYTHEELINKVVVSSKHSIWPENCKYVLERIIEKSKEDPKKFYFSRDSRLKLGPIVGMQHADLVEYAKRIKCPMIVIKATETIYFEDKKYVYSIIDTLKINNKNFEFINIEGTHHVHINEPEKIADIVKKFIEKNYNVGVDTKNHENK